MSLINDALKKAQKQRTGESPALASLPSVGGESAARIARRSKPVGFNSLMVRVGLGVVALVVLVIGGIFAVRFVLERPETPAPAKPAPVAQVVPKPAETPAPKPAESIAPPTFNVPAATPPTPAPVKPAAVPVAETKPAAATAPMVQLPPLPEPEPVKPAAPPPVPKMSSRAVAYLDGIRVAGIRASSTDSKVLMNDHVYRVGDIVEHELGLKLTGIASGALSFEDEHGAKYTRNF